MHSDHADFLLISIHVLLRNGHRDRALALARALGHFMPNHPDLPRLKSVFSR